MKARGARLLNGFLILFSSSLIFIVSGSLLKSGAEDAGSKAVALFLLFNPLIILVNFTFGIFWALLYLLFLTFWTQKLIYIHQAHYLGYMMGVCGASYIISAFLRMRFYFRIKMYRNKVRTAEDRLERLHSDLEENKRMKAALSKKFERFSKLKFVAEELSTTLTLEEVTQFAVNRIVEIIPRADMVLLYLVDEKNLMGDTPEIFLSSLKTDDPEFGSEKVAVDIFDRWMLRHVEPLLVTDVKKDFRFSPETIEEIRRDIRSLITAPLISENRILGILRLDSLTPENFGPDDLRILDIFSDLVAVAVENTLLYRKMEELAKRDGLTNLYLPRYFHTRLEEMINRGLYATQIFSLSMLDIDYFKEYNDRYGHIAGDIVLKKIANILAANLSENDFAVRYGGEEFLLVLFGSDQKAAVEHAESIRKEIAGQIFLLRRQETRITVSIGIATYPADGNTKEELLHKADEWLYYAKEKGRNHIAYTGVK